MWRHLTNGHVIEENRHQNNVKAHINNEMFQRILNLSNRTLKIDAKILDLLRRFKAGLVKVSTSIHFLAVLISFTGHKSRLMLRSHSHSIRQNMIDQVHVHVT